MKCECTVCVKMGDAIGKHLLQVERLISIVHLYDQVATFLFLPAWPRVDVNFFPHPCWPCKSTQKLTSREHLPC